MWKQVHSTSWLNVFYNQNIIITIYRYKISLLYTGTRLVVYKEYTFVLMFYEAQLILLIAQNFNTVLPNILSSTTFYS